jgi:hypothetical protein
VTEIAAYCSRFSRQIATVTLVPQLLGRAVGGPSVAADLSLMVEAFSIACRLIDDIRDVEDDLQTGSESAVWQCLEPVGRAAWAECRARSPVHGDLEPQSWAALLELLQAPGCIPRLLALIRERLDEAARLAERNHWHELAREILECRSVLMADPIEAAVVAAGAEVAANT